MEHRKITEIIIHCSASGPKTTLEDITKWHKERGFKTVGYHFVIQYDGKIRMGRSKDEVGAHCEGHNQNSIGICLVGGTDGKGTKTNFTRAQFDSLNVVIEGLMMSYGPLSIYPHNYFSNKLCPDFKVSEHVVDKLKHYVREK